MAPTTQPKPKAASSTVVHIGFIALNDAAPVIVAHEMGLFRRHGVRTALHREVGWATIRDKIVYRELDAAHALGAMAVSTALGLDCTPCPCVTAFVLSTGGNAITLSSELWDRGVRDSTTLRQLVARTRQERTFVFGVVFAHSSQHILLCDWLAEAGLKPGRDVRIVVVPPPQLYRNLSARTIDGYCAGDPWNSLAVQENAGWCPATSPELSPGHPEKVFMVREDFAERRKAEHIALVAALGDAAALCDNPAFRPELARMLSRREYLNVPEHVVSAGLAGRFDNGRGRSIDAADFIQFSRNGASDPTPAKAAWLIDGLTRHGLVPPGTRLPPDLGSRIFRTDIHQTASNHANNTVPA